MSNGSLQTVMMTLMNGNFSSSPRSCNCGRYVDKEDIKVFNWRNESAKVGRDSRRFRYSVM